MSSGKESLEQAQLLCASEQAWVAAGQMEIADGNSVVAYPAVVFHSSCKGF